MESDANKMESSPPIHRNDQSTAMISKHLSPSPHLHPMNFRRLFGILFTTFIFILVFIFAIIAITEKLTIASAPILIIIPLAIRYAVYILTKI